MERVDLSGIVLPYKCYNLTPRRVHLPNRQPVTHSLDGAADTRIATTYRV